MTETIREQIISAIESKMQIIREDRGYQTECGKNVFRVKKELDPDELDAVVIWPRAESNSREYAVERVTMPLEVQGLSLYGNENASVISEMILGDLIEALMGKRWTLNFTSGGTHQIRPGDTITGATGGATATVESVSIDSGSWGAGTAAGTLTIRRKSGDFQSENLDVGSESNVATIDGTIVYESAIDSVTDGLADDIIYQQGGTDEYPDSEQTVVLASVLVDIIYKILPGDPYNQPP